MAWYRGAVKSLARPGSKQATATEDFNFHIIIIGIQPLGRFGQRPEVSKATGMALVCCILGKFLGVVCHYFPPHLDFPLLPLGASTSATTRETLAAEGGTVGENVVQ